MSQSNETLKPEDARRRVEAKRAAFEESIRAVSSKIEAGADQVQQAVDRVKGVAERGHSIVERNAWVFIAAAVGAGLAMGVTGGKKRRRRLELPATAASLAALPLVEPRPSVVGGFLRFVGSSLLRSMTGVALVAAERVLQDKLGLPRSDDDDRRSR